MKKMLLLTFAIGMISICKAQQFSYQMTFVDAVGNADTLTLGYDTAATDTIDAILGELDIIGTPYTTGLDARVGNAWFLQNFSMPPPGTHGHIPFETKKQILPSMCGTGLVFWMVSPIAEINVVSSNFPITAYWDKTPFNDTCRNGSVFTGTRPDGWWDTPGFREELALKDSVTFDRNWYYYLSGSDTVFTYWVTFFDSTLLLSGINELAKENNMIQVYPNPATKSISIKSKKNFGDLDQVEIYNSFGQIVLITKPINSINISELNTGLYFIKVTNKSGLSAITKFQKI